MLDQIRADLAIIRERDPAARGWLEILFCYPGFHAISLHRFSHRSGPASCPKAGGPGLEPTGPWTHRH